MASPDVWYRDRRNSYDNKNYRNLDDSYQEKSNYNHDFSEHKGCQVRATGFPAEVSDIDINRVVMHEMKKFGDVDCVKLIGHAQNRQALVSFRTDDAAWELRGYCLERHCKVVAFQRALHFDFNLNSDRRGGFYHTPSHHSNHGGASAGGGSYKENKDFHPYNSRGGGGGDRYNNDSSINPRATRTLFVGNLDPHISKDELLRSFDQYGAIEDVDIKRPSSHGFPSYAFIKYLELEAAAAAKNQMFGRTLNGRLIKVGYGKTTPASRLWIGGLGKWCSVDMLTREFDRFGALKHIEYKNGSRHGFIEFESLEASCAAYNEMRGYPLGGPERKIKIDYAGQDEVHRGEQQLERRNSRDSYRSAKHDQGRSYESYNRRKSESEYSYDSRHHSRSRSPIRQKDHTKRDETSVKLKSIVVKSANGHKSSDIESLSDVCKRFVVAWRGAFALKNSAFPVRMHLIGGNPELANFHLRGIGAGAGPACKALNVTQRLRLDETKLDEVSKRVQNVGVSGHCILLALATSDEMELDSGYQKRPLKSLVTYFRKKEAAGVIILNSIGPSGNMEESGMLHAFPPCEFARQYMLNAAPKLGPNVSKEDHLLVIIVKGN